VATISVSLYGVMSLATHGARYEFDIIGPRYSPNIYLETPMKRSLRALVSIISVALAFGAAAQTATPNIDQRQASQQARIDNGKATGTLSKREASRMQAGQNKVAGMEAAAKADGKVTRRERAAITKEQNKQSRRIRTQKHDGNKL